MTSSQKRWNVPKTFCTKPLLSWCTITVPSFMPIRFVLQKLRMGEGHKDLGAPQSPGLIGLRFLQKTCNNLELQMTPGYCIFSGEILKVFIFPPVILWRGFFISVMEYIHITICAFQLLSSYCASGVPINLLLSCGLATWHQYHISDHVFVLDSCESKRFMSRYKKITFQSQVLYVVQSTEYDMVDIWNIKHGRAGTA